MSPSIAPTTAERPTIRLWALLLPNLLWITLGLFFALQLIAFSIADPWKAAWISLLDWGPWLVLSPVVLWLALRFPFGQGGSAWRPVAVHLLGAAGALIIVLALREWLPRPEPRDFMNRRPPPGFNPDDKGPRDNRQGNNSGPAPSGENPGDRRPPPAIDFVRIRLVVPIYVGLLLGAHVFIYQRSSRERQRRALLAEARLAEARLAALQAQLHPHFLFNSLNAVTSLVAEQPRQAEAMLCALADLLRDVLVASERREVSLTEELDFIGRYLTIQLIRFSDRLSIERDIANDALDAAVPPLILQPLVENAILHGIAPRPGPGRLALSARREGDRLVLTVRDDGLGIPQPGAPAQASTAGTGMGLKNIRARLAAIHGLDASLTLAPAPEGGTIATVTLPFRRATA